MKILNYKDIDKSLLKAFFEKVDFESLKSVNEIISKVRTDGDSALIELSRQFKDGDFKSAKDFIVSEIEIENAYKNVSKETVEALKKAINNVKEFAKLQLNSVKSFKFEKENSVLEQKIIPLESVLCYCPGGNYPLLSSCYMTIVPAVAAGVKNVFITSPKISNEVIVSSHLSGAKRIYKLGGAQAIAAFAYGTQTVPAVDKIVGPGNKFVAAAKKEVFGQCGIDFIAGPSEVLVVADNTIDIKKDSKLIAADLLAQCEHDKDARSYLITTSKELALEVKKCAYEFLENLKTAEIAKISFEKSMCIVVDNLDEAIYLANKKAPEHLELFIDENSKKTGEFTNYGSLFIGRNCAEVFGDYCSGTNHVLPTNQCAKYTGGLSVFDFIKIQTCQKLSENYSKELSPVASCLAEKEGLFAHKLAADLRG